jgi:hypothetical protein
MILKGIPATSAKSPILKLNERGISVKTCSRVRKLINELQQPDIMRPLVRDRFYVAV